MVNSLGSWPRNIGSIPVSVIFFSLNSSIGRAYDCYSFGYRFESYFRRNY